MHKYQINIWENNCWAGLGPCSNLARGPKNSLHGPGCPNTFGQAVYVCVS